jgi:cytochrome c oxidase accessory protein FixG
MFDKNTMQISYDYSRGEPRHKLSKDNNNFGDCVDCGKCVFVCPTGIDIRNGIQMECIGCTACIDACNEVMTKINRPLGLIRYASENEIALKQPFVFTKRLKAYTFLLAILLGGMLSLIFTRNNIDTLITRARGQLYQEQPNNLISNLYEAKIINKTNKALPVQLKVEGLEASIVLVGKNEINLKKEAISDVTFFVHLNKKQLTKRSNTIKIAVMQGGKKIQTISTKFLGPFI